MVWDRICIDEHTVLHIIQKGTLMVHKNTKEIMRTRVTPDTAGIGYSFLMHDNMRPHIARFVDIMLET